MRTALSLIIGTCLLLAGYAGTAQQLRLGSTPYSTEKSAVLELQSDRQGLLLCRISDTALINTMSPPDGMMIYYTPSKQLLIKANGYWRSLLTSVDTSDIANFHQKTRSLFSGVAPITFNSAGQIGITQASTSTNGYLSSTDWNTFNNKASAANTWAFGGNTVTTAKNLGTIDNIDLPFITNNTEKMRLTATGSLGIGTTAPTAPLHILANNGNLLYLQTLTGGGTGYTGILFKTYTGSANPSAQISAADDASYSSHLTFSTKTPGADANALAERVRITSSGNVGIGISTPAQKLDVRGAIVSSATTYPNYAYNSANRMAFGESNVPANETGSVVQYGSGSSSRNMIFAFTKTNVNTSFFGNDGTQMMLGSESTAPITFRTGLVYTSANIIASGSEAMRITSTGLVGIGTASPSTKLHVAGTNPLTLTGVQAGTSTSADSLLTITSGLVRKLPMSTFASAFTTGDLTESGSGILTITGGTNAVTGSGTTIQVKQASGSQNGFLSSADWSAFNSKLSSVDTGSISNFYLKSRSLLSAGTGISYNNNTGAISNSGVLSVNGNTGALTMDTGYISNFYLKSRGLLSAGTGIGYNNNTGAISNSGVLSVNGNTGALTMDTGYISNFYLKSRGLLSAGTGITYNATTGVISSSLSTGSFWAMGGNAVASAQNLGTTSNYDLPFITNNTERMRLSSAGNLGIGASSFNGTYPEKLLVDAGTTTSVNAIVGKGTINNYLQLNIQNQSAGTSASSDVVATANNGSETTNYVDMGINSSGNTNNYFGGANDAYLYNIGQNLLVGTATAGKNLVFMTGGGTQSTNERMRIDGSGNVGIGVTNPDNPLVVKDTFEIRRTGTMSELLFSNTAGAGDFRIAGDGGDIFWQGGGGRSLQMGSYWGMILGGDRQSGTIPSFSNGTGNTGVLVQSQRDASIPLAIQANSASQSGNLTEWRTSSGTVLNVVDADGNVGIGTSSFNGTYPEKLVVDAGVTSSVNAIVGKGTINSYLQLNIQNLSTGTSASSDVVATANNGSETANYIDMGINGGNYSGGIMGSSNDAYLYNIGQNLLIGTGTASKSVVFMTGGTAQGTNERMRIDGSGSVGIATTSPQAKLDVNGNFKLGTTGTVLTGMFKTSVSITDNTNNIVYTQSLTKTVTVTGAAVNANVIVTPRSALPNGVAIAWSRVSSSGSVQINFINSGAGVGGNQLLGTITFDITIIQ